MDEGVCVPLLFNMLERQETDMKFGLFQSVQLPEPGAQAKYYKEALEQVRWAEQLGFWAPEAEAGRYHLTYQVRPGTFR